MTNVNDENNKQVKIKYIKKTDICINFYKLS